MLTEQLSPQTVNTYLALLGTILNAAVDDDYLPRSPLLRKSGAGRTATTRNQPVPRREVWLLREQLDRLVDAIDPRYRALVLVAALTGMRWGELVAGRRSAAGPPLARAAPRCFYVKPVLKLRSHAAIGVSAGWVAAWRCSSASSTRNTTSDRRRRSSRSASVRVLPAPSSRST
jgi:hypothetical protein